MKFCEECGTKLKFKQIKIEGQLYPCIMCEKCGTYTKIEKVSAKPKESIPKTNIKVLGDETNDISTLPTISIECPKCGNMVAFWWLLQTRSGDEPATQFYRCTKCNYTWRLYA